MGRWKFEKGVEFNRNLDKNRIEHLLFNLLSYTDETTNIQKSNIDEIVTEFYLHLQNRLLALKIQETV